MGIIKPKRKVTPTQVRTRVIAGSGIHQGLYYVRTIPNYIRRLPNAKNLEQAYEQALDLFRQRGELNE